MSDEDNELITREWLLTLDNFADGMGVAFDAIYLSKDNHLSLRHNHVDDCWIVTYAHRGYALTINKQFRRRSDLLKLIEALT